ncbi:MAG: hypothetical protein IJR07_09270 [Bacteroidaceae bacterium]|nr:hypothetical protein [Bacteroidaceae bacterium]
MEKNNEKRVLRVELDNVTGGGFVDFWTKAGDWFAEDVFEPIGDFFHSIFGGIKM